MGRLARHLHVGVRGAVRVELERSALQAGDLLIGVVHLHVTKPIHSAELRVHIRGFQRLLWWTSMDEIRYPQWRNHTHLEHTIQLAAHDTMFLDGHLQYPFSFRLPTQELPPTLKFRRSRIDNLEDVRVKVAYDVQATLHVDAFATADLSATAPFTVVEPVPRSLHFDSKPVSAQEDDCAVKLLWLSRRGACGMRLALDTDVFDANSTVEAHVRISLHTSRKLKYVRLALYQDATVDRQCGEKRLKKGAKRVCSRRFEPAELNWGPDGCSLETTLLLPLSHVDKPKSMELMPRFESRFLALAHHIALECHFVASSTTRVCAPVGIVGDKSQWKQCRLLGTSSVIA